MDDKTQHAMNAVVDTIGKLEGMICDLRCVLAELVKPAAPAPQVPEAFRDCISRNVPEGYDTVLGFLAKYHPEVLELMNPEDPEATCRDGFWLGHRYKDRVYVPAPDALRKAGILRVRAWPIDLLQQRFG